MEPTSAAAVAAVAAVELVAAREAAVELEEAAVELEVAAVGGLVRRFRVPPLPTPRSSASRRRHRCCCAGWSWLHRGATCQSTRLYRL